MTPKKQLIDKALMDILACPVCKNELKLVDLRGRNKELDGKLICTNVKCKEEYPIKEGIPILLPKELRD